eukprot:TRINITY_DN4615_c0_g2_i5.p1 TRINITY_DN4615_c0_g2~~TRINITY_DN4615_c0_g2_i5.p1  ORF type:complete len:216 (-),score=44.23 TRINITY_DN4615_c0_g2_i5:71-640(-)
MVLKASTYPPEGINLELECHEDNNPQFLAPAQIVARMVRERCCRWISEKILNGPFIQDFSSTTLTQTELERLLLDFVGFTVEMLVAANYAKEDVRNIFVMDQVISIFKKIVKLVTVRCARDMFRNFDDCLSEIYVTVTQPDTNMKYGPTTMNLWGQGSSGINAEYFFFFFFFFFSKIGFIYVWFKKGLK